MNEAPIVRTESNTLPEAAKAFWLDSFDGARLRVMDYGGDARRGTALIVPGWTEACEKYAEVALDLIDRGFHVVGYDPRGQGLSQRVADGDTRGRVDSLDKHISDLGAVIDHLSAERLTLVAHSMGGLLALSWLAQGGKAEAAVLCAPATRLYPLAPVRMAVNVLAWAFITVGQADFPMGREGGMAMEFEGNKLTSDPKRHAMQKDLLLANEGLDLPRPYPAFVAAMQRQQAVLHAEGGLDGLTVPTLIISAAGDEVVDATDHPNIAKRSSHLSLVTLEGAKHELLMERDEIRDQFWDACDAHLDRYVTSDDAAST